MNPILETIGIINLERSADPIQQAVAQLMSMVEGVSGDVQSLRSAMRDLQITNSGHASGTGHASGVGHASGISGLFTKTGTTFQPVEGVGISAGGPLTLRSE